MTLSLLLLSLAPPVALAEGNGAGEVKALQYHWTRPARAVNNGQNKPSDTVKINPAPYPKECGTCHSTKYKEWSTSLHSRSVGPGLLAQLSPIESPGFATSCYRCHAPLLEQSEAVKEEDGYGINPAFDKKLQTTGISCAACHLRESVVYGPEGPSAIETTEAGHHTEQKSFFSSAEFCAACHQLDAGYELNGRVLTNTYNEWKESRYADSGVTCQMCHMPSRRHLWQGIHYPEMVLSGLDIKANYNNKSKNKRVEALLTITNTGVGHMFPTYVTPSVTVTGFLLDQKGNIIEASRSTVTIGRRIALDLSEELFDTRIAPDEKFEFAYSPPPALRAAELVFEVVVKPDEFYNRFFASILNGMEKGRPEEQSSSVKMYKEAYRATLTSEYLLYRKAFQLID